MVELSWMNTDAQTEVNMFLRATEMNPSHISLGGFFDVNRNLFKSVSHRHNFRVWELLVECGYSEHDYNFVIIVSVIFVILSSIWGTYYLHVT